MQRNHELFMGYCMDLFLIRNHSKMIFHKMTKLCKIGMGKYPPGELVALVDSGKISFSSKAEKSRNANSYT